MQNEILKPLDQKIQNGAYALLVAIGEYDHHNPLPFVSEEAEQLAQALEDGGYQIAHRQILSGETKGLSGLQKVHRGNSQELGLLLDNWLRESSSKDTLLLFWAGHGILDGTNHFLVTKESPTTNLTDLKAINTRVIGQSIAYAPAEKILVVLDTCHAGAGANQIANTLAAALATRTPIPGRERAIAVIASTHPLQSAQEAAFCSVFREVLNSPHLRRRWSDEDRFIHTDYLTEAVKEELKQRGIVQTPVYKADGSGQEFVPNPRYRGPQPAEDVETRYLRLAKADVEAHFLPASRGIEVGEAGWYFTGRTRLLRELVQWIEKAEKGIFIVTGPPGAGKSAVMGRLAILSDHHYRDRADSKINLKQAPRGTVPPAGAIDVSVHVKGKGIGDCVLAIAYGLGLQLGEEKDADVDALLEAVENTNRRIIVMVDALDEAKPGHANAICNRLMNPLGRLSKVRVMVGTRRSPDGKTIPEDEDPHGRLKLLFGEGAIIRDVADEPEAEVKRDIAEYVSLRLAESKHRDNPDAISHAARAVAEKADGIFLYARIVSRTLKEAETLEGPLPDSAIDAFVADLGRRFGEQAGLVDEVLRALAWGLGRGLTRRVWAGVATALSLKGAVYKDTDIDWVLANAGWHIIETGEQEQAVYRLPHQALADRYRKQHDTMEANRQIILALTKSVEGASWLDTDRYLWRYVADHAASAGELDRLVQDPGFLAVVEPKGLVQLLTKITNPLARRIANVYRTAFSWLRDVNPIERMARIHLTANQMAPDLVTLLNPVLPTAWKCRWADWMRLSPNIVISDHKSEVRSVAIGEINGRPVIVSGCWEIIRIWDAVSGEPIGDPLTGHEGRVRSVAIGEINGRPVIVSGGGRTIRIWDAVSGEPVGKPLTGPRYKSVRTMAIGEINGRPVIVSGISDTVRIWDALTGEPIGDPLIGHEKAVNSVAIGEIKGRMVIVSGSYDNTIRIWDALTGESIGDPLTGHEGGVNSVAIGEINGRPVIVSGISDTVRIWDALTGEPIGDPLTGHNEAVNSVATGEINGRLMIVSGAGRSGAMVSKDNTVRIWDALTGEPIGDPLIGHEKAVESVAIGEINGRPVIVSGGEDKTVRIWDAVSGEPEGERLIGHETQVESVAIGEINGRPVIVSGKDKTVRIWDAVSGEPEGELLLFIHHLDSVHSVGIGEINGRSVIVSLSYGNTVWIWDAVSGEPVGKRSIGPKHSVDFHRAIGEINGRPVIVSGFSDTVRIWDAIPVDARVKPLKGKRVYSIVARIWETLTGYEPACVRWKGPGRWVNSVAIGEIDGRPVIVLGSKDSIIQIRDALTGEPIGEPLIGHEKAVESVAIGEINGRPVIVSGGEDKTVRIWDVTSVELVESIPLDSQINATSLGNNGELAVATGRGIVVIEISGIF